MSSYGQPPPFSSEFEDANFPHPGFGRSELDSPAYNQVRSLRKGPTSRRSERRYQDGAMLPPPPPPPVSGAANFFGPMSALDENDLTDATEKGERCESKDVYFVPRDDDPNIFHWVDEKPLHYGISVTYDKTKTKKMRETFAVNILHVFDKKEYNGLSTSLTRHELKSFSPPFLPFVHRWQDFLDYIDILDVESETRTHMQLLQQVLEPLLQDSFKTIQDVQITGHVSFKDLPLIYIPATTVLKHATNCASIVRICQRSQSYSGPCHELYVDVVDWDGRRCGLLSQKWQVKHYHGLRALIALEVSPIKGLPDEHEISKQLIQRGRIFEKLRGHFFMAFTDEREERINERMIIDARAYHKYEISFPYYAKLSEIGRLTWAQSMNRHSPQAHDRTERTVEVELVPMTDEQCLLAVSTVICFSIEKKRWERLDLIKFHEIAWAQHAFNSLVLDQGEKDLLLALVDRDHFHKDKSLDDFIEGKGQGMIMLLCGPPGVGKTLTAETISEHLHRPLYKLGAGDLGIDASDVENCLDKALKLCAHFGAVLLLDEADVFMEARTSNNLHRNELVSVFLRLLEYYSGIMILTTNRVRSLDAAFESRIDIILTYKSFTEADRIQVWRNFLALMNPEDFEISDAELLKLAHWDFNGRQIKGAIKTARILAAKKNEPLNAQHLDVVLRLRSKAIGMIDSEAKPEGLRENGFTATGT